MSKITRKSYKRKKIIMGAALFGAVGLVSTGFAAWVLSASTSETLETSLSVGAVSDKSMDFKDLEMKDTDDLTADRSTYVFEPDSTDDTGRVRYDGVNSEHLSITVSGTLEHANFLGKMTATVTWKEGGQTVALDSTDAPVYENGLAEAVAKGYIVAPAAYYDEVVLWQKAPAINICSLTPVENETLDSTFTYVVEFAWGNFFNRLNPSLFFDSNEQGVAAKKGTDYSMSEVSSILTELHTLLDGVQLNLNLVADPD